ncbi:MAG TPA: tetratricopeptide repeat protein [Pirellulales bacterium]|nr:tetratricopeptide repeat protein [Pirellulales bacterium]
MAEDTKGRQPIPPGKRKMLQQCFEAGSSKSASGNFDYAAQMFTQCVVGDPANLLYAQNFLANLQKKYNNNKSGAALAAMRSAKSKGGVTYASKRKDWLGVIASGLEVLKLNPWDTGTLAEMANACDHLQFEECQIVWLKGALEADIKDPEVNRLLGRALAKQGQFDQAIACWMRVQQAKPNDEEAHRAIANLQVEKTIHKGGYEDAESSTEVMADKQAMADRQGTGGQRLSPEQQLEKRIAKDPANISLYLELADLHVKQEQFTQAEAVLKRGLEASGGSLEVREYLEDVELRHARHQVLIAEKRAKAENSDEAVELYNRMKNELNNKELETYRNRCERYPTNLGYKYELGVRLFHAKNFQEGIRILQEARTDPKRKGMVLFWLGACFEAIKQYKLALTHYEEAIEHISDRSMDDRKRAMYRAGCVGMDRVKDYEKAEKHLNALAGLDFAYKDVGERLDKLQKLREDSET